MDRAVDLHFAWLYINWSSWLLIFQIHDVAEFLGGDLKTKNQHILLQYKKTCKATSSNQLVTVPFNQSSSSSRLVLQASILSTSPVLRLETSEQGNDKSTILKPKGSMARVESQPCTAGYLSAQTNKLHLSASDPDLRNIKHSGARRYLGSTGNVKANVASTNGCRPLPPPPPGHKDQVTKSNSNRRFRAGSVDHRRRKRPTTPRQQRQTNDLLDLDSSSSSTELELTYQHSSHTFQRQQSADFSCPHYRAPSPRASSPYEGNHYRSDSYESPESVGEIDDSDSESNGSTFPKFEITELHLYILTENSLMFMQLRSTWNNCILVSYKRGVSLGQNHSSCLVLSLYCKSCLLLLGS